MVCTGMMTRRGLLGVLAGAAIAVGFASCGENEGAGREAATASINIGVLPIADVAPLYLGRSRGFFADEGLEVEPRLMGAGAIIPGVVSGELQLGWNNATSVITARSKGLPLRMLSRGVRGGSKLEDSSVHILAKVDGPIRSPKDLEGRTISVAALQSVSTLTANAALEKQGVDVSKVKYIEVPFPQAIGALESGRVDAAYVAEPFSTIGLKAGHRSIVRPIFATAPDLIVASYFTTETFIAKHKGVLDRFDRAVNRSYDYASEHPGEVREILSTYTTIPLELVKEIGLPDFSAYTDTSTLDLTAVLAKKYGYIEREPDISDLLYKP